MGHSPSLCSQGREGTPERKDWKEVLTGAGKSSDTLLEPFAAARHRPQPGRRREAELGSKLGSAKSPQPVLLGHEWPPEPPPLVKPLGSLLGTHSIASPF